jgi:hypothetical protein
VLRKPLFLSLLLASITGCTSVAYQFSHTGEKEYEPKKVDCKFRILSGLPQGKFEEIGVVNMTHYGDKLGAVTTPNTPGQFDAIIRNDICNAGAELVVGEVNGLGHYVRGTVYKKLP